MRFKITYDFDNVGTAAVQRGAKTKGGRAAAAASNATSCPDQASHGAGQGRRGDVAQEAPKEEREQQQQRRRGRGDHFLQYPDVAAAVVTDPAAGFNHHNIYIHLFVLAALHSSILTISSL